MMNSGYRMMGAGIGCYSMGAAGNLEYYLYNKSELNLSMNQVKDIESLKNRYFEKNLALRRELLEKNFELEKVLSAENVDLSRVKSLTNEIGNINAELRYNAIESFTRAKNVLTEEQRNRLGAEPFRGHMMN
jgi:Spy/CpxP family protein refolding chaperone